MFKRKKQNKIEQETINYLNDMLPVKLKYRHDHLMIDNKYARIGVIKSYPSTLPYFAAFAKFRKLQNVYVVQKNMPLDHTRAIDLIETKFKSNNINRGANKKTSNVQSNFSDANAEKVYNHMLKTNETMYDSTTFIMWYADNKADLKVKENELIGTLKSFNATLGNLDAEQQKAHRTMLMSVSERFGGLEQNMLSSSLARLFPFAYGERLDPDGVLIGYEKNTRGLFMLDFFNFKELGNGNAVILGRSGEGKSFLEKKILSWYIASNYQTFTIDSDNREYSEIHKRQNATNIRFNGKFFINILEFRISKEMLEDDEISEDDDIPVPEYLQKESIALNHIAWLRDFFAIYKKELSERQLDILEILLTKFYEKCGLMNILNLKQLESENYPIISDFYNFIKLEKDNYHDAAYSKDDLNDFIIAFKSIAEGADSMIFNGHTNIPNLRNINFDIFDLIERRGTALQGCLFNMMTYIWKMISQTVEKSAMFADELYLLVNDKNDMMVDLVRNMQKRIRKYNGHTVLGTQNISDLLVKGIKEKTQPIISNSSIKFLFFPGEDELGKFADLLKCTTEELDLIKKTNRGNCLTFVGSKKYYVSIKELGYEDGLFGKAGGH